MAGPAPKPSRPFVLPSLASLEAPTEDERARAEAEARSAAYQQGFDQGSQKGYERGRTDAMAEAARAAQADIAKQAEVQALELVRATTSAIKTALGRLDHLRTALDTDARAAVTAALQAVFPVLLKHHGGREAAAIVAEAISSRPAALLQIKASQDTISALQDLGLTNSLDGRVSLLTDSSLTPGSVDIRWTATPAGENAGGLAFDAAELASRVLTAVSDPADGTLAKNPGESA